MNIKIKSINHKLMFFMDDTCSYDLLLEDLKKLLESSLFKRSEYYPRAFFDFKSRLLSKNDIVLLMNIINNNTNIIFTGINGLKKSNNISLCTDKIRNGHEIYVFDKTLFLYQCNLGSYIYVYDDVYFLNKVRSTIIAYNSDIKICGHHFEGVSIYICGKVIHNVTFFSLTTIYYDGENICVVEEEGL